MEPSEVEDVTQEQPPTDARALLREFLHAATRTSAPALIGTLIVAAVLILVCTILVTPRNLARINEGYFMASHTDSYASLTGRTFKHRFEGFKDNSVIIIGSSAIQHGFRDSDVIERDVKELKPIDVHVVKFIGLGISMWEMLDILGEVKGPTNGVVVLGLSPAAFSHEDSSVEDLIEHPRLPFISEPYAEEIRKQGIALPRRTGIYFFDHSGFFTARIRCTLNLLTGPRVLRRNHDVHVKLPDAGAWDRAMVTVGNRLQEYDENSPKMYKLLGDIIDVVRAKGKNHVVVVEPPMNPKAIAEMHAEPIFEKFRRDMRAFAKKHGIEFWDLAVEAKLDPADFADWYHLHDTPSRERYTRAFARHIAELMTEPREKTGS